MEREKDEKWLKETEAVEKETKGWKRKIDREKKYWKRNKWKRGFEMSDMLLEKIIYRVLIPEFYVIQICKHWRSVAIG